MRKALVLSFLSVLFFVQSHAAQPGQPANSMVANNKIAATFNARITLVHTDGTPVTGSTGLHGYWVRNTQTGVYYDATNQEGTEFEGLPAGTYTFGAYPGNWDGAVSKTITLDSSLVGPDGFIVVQLVYWVE
jgi:hypothetical protein